MSDSDTGLPSWRTPQPADGTAQAGTGSADGIVQPRPASEYLGEAAMPVPQDEQMPPAFPPAGAPRHVESRPSGAFEGMPSVPEVPHLESAVLPEDTSPSPVRPVAPVEPAAAPVAQPVSEPVAPAEPVVAAPAAPATSEPAPIQEEPAPAPVSEPESAQAPEPVAEPQDSGSETAEDGRYLELAEEAGRTAKATADELTGLRESLEELSKQFSKRLQYDDAKETIIDRQHRELTQLREGLKENLIQPVLYDVAEALDSVHKMRAKLAAEAHEADSALEDVEFMLLDILEKNDVDEVSSEPGEPFDATRQRMAKVEETEDASKRKVIARSLAPGYMFGKYALFKEKVVVYKVVPPQAGPAAATPDAG